MTTWLRMVAGTIDIRYDYTLTHMSAYGSISAVLIDPMYQEGKYLLPNDEVCGDNR